MGETRPAVVVEEGSLLRASDKAKGDSVSFSERKGKKGVIRGKRTTLLQFSDVATTTSNSLLARIFFAENQT